MEWYWSMSLIFGGILALMMTGLPVAFCFVLLDLVVMYVFWGGEPGARQLILSIYQSVGHFSLVPIPLFILMGEVMFHSGIGSRMMDAIDAFVGRLPGRLALVAVTGGTLFASLSGSSNASTAMLGSVLVPEMEKRGYSKQMSLGPIMGSGALAILIPPTSLGVVLGAMCQVSVGKLLIAIITPGVMLAIFYAIYVIVRCWLQPHLASPYVVNTLPMSQKIGLVVRNLLPLALVMFAVMGVIFVGIATPTEAAALGAVSCFFLAFCIGKLDWALVKKSIAGTMSSTIMFLMVVAGATAFGQIISFSGSGTGLLNFIGDLKLSPLASFIAMQAVILFLGCFMGAVPILMICCPIFMPIVHAIGIDPLWFAVVVLLNLEMGQTTPPFGSCLFVMKGVAPRDTTMSDVYRAALPFLLMDFVLMGLLIAFPVLVSWLPDLMTVAR
jgi:tripartite ATP-independent transporter DctM subunit